MFNDEVLLKTHHHLLLNLSIKSKIKVSNEQKTRINKCF